MHLAIVLLSGSEAALLKWIRQRLSLRMVPNSAKGYIVRLTFKGSHH